MNFLIKKKIFFIISLYIPLENERQLLAFLLASVMKKSQQINRVNNRGSARDWLHASRTDRLSRQCTVRKSSQFQDGPLDDKCSLEKGMEIVKSQVKYDGSHSEFPWLDGFIPNRRLGPWQAHGNRCFGSSSQQDITKLRKSSPHQTCLSTDNTCEKMVSSSTKGALDEDDRLSPASIKNKKKSSPLGNLLAQAHGKRHAVFNKENLDSGNTTIHVEKTESEMSPWKVKAEITDPVKERKNKKRRRKFAEQQCLPKGKYKYFFFFSTKNFKL